MSYQIKISYYTNKNKHLWLNINDNNFNTKHTHNYRLNPDKIDNILSEI